MSSRVEHCLHEGPGETVAVVKMPRTRGQTERPREPLLQVDTGRAAILCSIAGRLRGGGASHRGATGEIPAWIGVRPHRWVAPIGTVFIGQFDWGGLLPNGNG